MLGHDTPRKIKKIAIRRKRKVKKNTISKIVDPLNNNNISQN